MENLKSKRKVLRTAVSKLFTRIENEIKNTNVNKCSLEESLKLLTVKAEELSKLDLQIEELLDSDSFEAEFEASQDYAEKINVWQFRAERKLNELTGSSESINDNKHVVRLPKLTIPKFNGDSLYWNSFWNSFRVAIHNNTSLSKVEKFNYLRSYLSANALSAIEGFSISDENYDSVVEILKNRFGRRDIIIHAHMNKLLNLAPVHRSDDIVKLRHLYDTLEIQVRSLKSLDVKPEAYSTMLISVLLKILPPEITLEFNRRNGDYSANYNIEKLLEFIRTELECRERNALFSISGSKSRFNLQQPPMHRNTMKWNSTTHGLMAAAASKGEDRVDHCLFCSGDHKSYLCRVGSAYERKEVLRRKGLCFFCLGKHTSRQCFRRRSCNRCKGQHNQAICFKVENKTNVSHMESLENKSEVGGAVAESQVLSTISERKPQCVLLQTCDVKIRNDTKVTRARLLLDNGSMRSFVDKDIACKLKLPVIRRESLSVFTFGNKSPIKKTFDVVKIELENREKPDFSVKIEALVTEQISGSDLPPSNLKAEIVQKYLEGFQLADSCSKGKVAVLVGADYYHNIVLGGIRRLKGQLVATETIFGWCLIGRDSDVRDVSVSLNIIIEEDLISGLIKKFWELESLGIAENEFSDPSNDSVLQRFESEIEYQNSRYRVRLPWKSDKKYILSDNKKVAERRFERLRRRFVRNPELYKSYQAVLHDYLQQKIIELVPNTCDAERITFYLPHREVVRNDRSSSKFRVVFDASSHDVGEVSLNDCLHIGPNLYPDIFDLLLRFRLHPIAFTADIKQAFLQIEVNEKDRDVSRFLFTDDPTDVSKSPQIYRFTRVLFGVNSSPFMLAATIKHHLRKYQGIYPETSEFLNNSIYVDDIIGGHQNTEDAYHTSTECMHIFREAGMTLHKWQTNSEELRKLWIKEDMVSGDSSQVVEPSGLPFKVLGVSWNKREDSLYFDVQNLVTFLSSRVNSKRCLLQAIGRIFDPVGFLGPFVLRVKLLMQEIWKLPLDWDDDLPECLSLAWNRWCNEVPGLGELRIPRYLFSNMFNVGITKIELHCFSDASQKAYATVAYLRILFNDERIRTVFVASKTRVAPLKKLTLPRLELMGALLSARLSYRIIKALNLNLVCRFWTDSQITLFWIKGTANKFKSFIKNRVEEIVKLTSPEDWYFCPGKSNPSDLASRGTSVFELRDNPVWFQGPEWLELTSEYWPMQNNAILEGLDGIELEYRKTVSNVIQFGCTVNSEKLLVLENYSSLRRLYRVTAWIKRFIKRVKKIVTTKGPLTTEELEEAEMHWIQVEQRQCYSEEFETLAGVGQVKKNSSLYNFGPFLDDKGILRMGGRLEYSDFSSDEKHPIILPRNSSLTGLIVQDEHICMKHGGIATTLAKIRSRFWIPKGRQIVQKIIRRCLICRRYSAKSADQLTSQLPEDRIAQTPPFYSSGVDFAGPIYVKNLEGMQKSYIVLFTCATTRALHLELAPTMTTESFLMAFRRFISRRGNCRIMYSDNARTFKKSNRELEQISKILLHDNFHDFFCNQKITWKFIVERGAWWGGFYERLVKSVKECLRKVLGRALLSFEELSTILTEVEAVLNSRPLTYVYNDLREPLPLQPVQFLNFARSDSTLPINFKEIIAAGSSRPSLIKRKNYQDLLVKQLWSKWKKQYIMDLRNAHALKNPNPQQNIKIDDVVLIEGDNKSKLLWKLGRVIQVFPGRDGGVRSCLLKTSDGTLKRPVQLLYPLEL